MKSKRQKNRKFFSYSFYPKNNKGFLLGETTVKIVIAVICIIFLVYLLFSLYYAQINSAKLKQARATLTNSRDSIGEVIERVRVGQGNMDLISEKKLIHNPSGWYLFSYTGNNKKPNSCAGDNCLCICDKVWVDTLLGIMDSRQLKECDENGVCLIVSDLKDKEVNFKIEPNTELLIKKENNFIGVSKI
jgi:hypothetical protein